MTVDELRDLLLDFPRNREVRIRMVDPDGYEELVDPDPNSILYRKHNNITDLGDDKLKDCQMFVEL